MVWRLNRATLQMLLSTTVLDSSTKAAIEQELRRRDEWEAAMATLEDRTN